MGLLINDPLRIRLPRHRNRCRGELDKGLFILLPDAGWFLLHLEAGINFCIVLFLATWASNSRCSGPRLDSGDGRQSLEPVPPESYIK